MDKSIVSANQLAVRSPSCYEFSNPNEAVVVEIEDDDTSVGTVEKQMEELKLNYQSNEKDVPGIFKTLINDQMSDLKIVQLQFHGSIVLLGLDDIHIRFEKKSDDYTITYEQVDTTIKTVDLKKSIIDHFWFVLKNPKIKLKIFKIIDCKKRHEKDRQVLDFEKLNMLLQSMIDSIDHQIQTNLLDCKGFNEDTFLSMLKHVKPGVLEWVDFEISWKEERNYQKTKDIVETQQWKQARTISSFGVTPLKIDDFFHCEKFRLELASVTPEDVLRVVEHVFNSSCHKRCKLSCEHNKYDIDAIVDFLRSQNDITKIVKIRESDLKFNFVYGIVKPNKHVLLAGKENYVYITTD